MPRVKRGTVRRAKRQKLAKLTKGSFLNKSKLYRAMKEAADRAGRFAYRDRRRRKRDFRRLWIVRISAAARAHQLTYSQFIHGLDRKSTRLNSSHLVISYAVFCLKKKKINRMILKARVPPPELRERREAPGTSHRALAHVLGDHHADPYASRLSPGLPYSHAARLG